MAEPQWVLYVSSAGRAAVEDEIRDAGLTADEVASLQKMLDRIASGEILKKDTKYLKGPKLWEARLDGNRRIFRLLFAKRKGQTLLVGLLFTAKKKDKLPPQVFRTAAQRLEDWDSQQ